MMQMSRVGYNITNNKVYMSRNFWLFLSIKGVTISIPV